MAIIVKPFTFIPGTVIRSSEVNLDFDTLYSDYNGNIDNTNIAAAAAIQYSKLQALPSAQLLIGSAGNVATPRAMTGDGTISNTGVLTVTGSGGGPPGTFNNITLTGTTIFNSLATFNNTATFNANVLLSTFTPGSILFTGAGGLISQDNANLFFSDTTNTVGFGTNAPLYRVDIRNNTAATQLHLSGTNNDTGLYGFVGAASGSLGFNSSFDGAQFIAKSTEAAVLNFGNNLGQTGLGFYYNTGLVAGSPYVPGAPKSFFLNTGELLLPDRNFPTANYGSRRSFVKAWAYINSGGGILASYNIASVNHPGVGNYQVNWTVPFSSANYCVVATAASGGSICAQVVGIAANSVAINVFDTTGATINDAFMLIAMGIQ